jgi:hypothetical protein
MEKCKHEFVTTEYLSQPIGTCEECGATVIKNEDGNWVNL